jgi:hypothetical protein
MRLMCHPIVDSGSAELGRDLAGAVVLGEELGHLGRGRGAAGGTVSLVTRPASSVSASTTANHLASP